MIKADMKRIVLLLLAAFCLTASQTYGQSEAERLYGLAYCYQNGVNGYSQDLSKAYENYKKVAEMGYAPSFYALGCMLEFGQGTSVNLQEAFKWYMKSAKAGNESGQYSLAWCYRSGIGVEKDDEKAIEWFKACAKKGNLDAYNQAGYILECKQSEEANKEAFDLYTLAANGNDKKQTKAIAEGQYRLAMCYINGVGVDFDKNGKNADSARQLLRKSAAHGSEGGKYSQKSEQMLNNPIVVKPMLPVIDFLDLKDNASNPFTLTIGVKANNVVKK